MAKKRAPVMDDEKSEKFPLLDIKQNQLITRVGSNTIRRYFTEDGKRWHEDIFYPSAYGVEMLESSYKNRKVGDESSNNNDITFEYYEKFKNGEPFIFQRHFTNVLKKNEKVVFDKNDTDKDDGLFDDVISDDENIDDGDE